MSADITYEQALQQWNDLRQVGLGTYWRLDQEPAWAVQLTRAYGAAWREVAYQRIARACIERVEELEQRQGAGAPLVAAAGPAR